MAYLFKLSSRLIVEQHLPSIASDAYGIVFVEETHTTRDQYSGCIATVSDRNCFTRIHSHSVELIGLVILCVFFSSRLFSVLPGFVYKRARLDFDFVVIIFLQYFIDSAQNTCKHT
jgi:hypothetical protein